VSSAPSSGVSPCYPPFGIFGQSDRSRRVLNGFEGFTLARVHGSGEQADKIGHRSWVATTSERVLHSTRIRFSVHMPGAARQSTKDRHSAMVRKQFDRVAEAAHRVFANAFEIEIALDEVGKRAGQQHVLTQLFGQGFQTRSHVNRGTDHGGERRAAAPGAVRRRDALRRP